MDVVIEALLLAGKNVVGQGDGHGKAGQWYTLSVHVLVNFFYWVEFSCNQMVEFPRKIQQWQ